MSRVKLFAIAGALFAVAFAATPIGATPQHRACVRSCKHNAKQCKKTCTPPSPPKEIKQCKAGCVQIQKSCVKSCP
jgi:hypothetical protein